MNRDALRARLTKVDRLLSDPIRGDEAHAATARRTPAAVLVGLVPRAAGPQVILTRRSEHLRDHAGQISFPGGRVEALDRDASQTALREAHEEIGLDPARVDIMGLMPIYRTITGFAVEPVVGWIDNPGTYRADSFEVAEIFEVPLSFILDVGNHGRGVRLRDGVERGFYVLSYQERNIWGATAGMLVNLATLLNAPDD